MHCRARNQCCDIEDVQYMSEMNSASKGKLLTVSIIFLVTGSIFVFIENIFYQAIDENGFLHESLFILLGLFGVFIFAIKNLLNDEKMTRIIYFSIMHYLKCR